MLASAENAPGALVSLNWIWLFWANCKKNGMYLTPADIARILSHGLDVQSKLGKNSFTTDPAYALGYAMDTMINAMTGSGREGQNIPVLIKIKKQKHVDEEDDGAFIYDHLPPDEISDLWIVDATIQIYWFESNKTLELVKCNQFILIES